MGRRAAHEVKNMLRFQKAKPQNTVLVVIYDWDDREIGRVLVPKGVDARGIVNEYIKTHLIHPQLREGVDHTSLARAMSYRGKYPWMAPAPVEDTTGAVADGEDYPLTNKLDYAYVKGTMTRGEDGKYIITDPDPEDPYPYLHGLVEVRDLMAPPWTTVGVGELKEYEHRKGAGP